ncbi:hypothetical protein ACFVWG_12425 [Kribbella sp. NPDC058245]|uniref:hypothetical protein n=1 Tax=Kribbella sp. NPDC058245 TaxID=3346399 RepID=UPI0036E53C33
MSDTLAFAPIPQVLSDDEVPFVLSLTPDARRFQEIGGARYRRGTDRYTIEWPVETIGLRAVVMNVGGISYLMANAGPLLTDWWPVLRRGAGSPDRPLVSACLAGEKIIMQTSTGAIDLTIVPSAGDVDYTLVVLGLGHGFASDEMIVAHHASLAAIKVALLLGAEYRTLVDTVPDMGVPAGEGTIDLVTMLDLAAEIAAQITWSPKPR